MKPKIYIDTSIVGGYFDIEFQDTTRKLFDRVTNNEIVFILSDLLEIELLEAPRKVRELLDTFPKTCFEYVSLSEESVKLADAYIAGKVVGNSSLEDCRHIALATVCKADVVASWNFKHIVNLDKIRGYNSINQKLGYGSIEIRSPKELINE